MTKKLGLAGQIIRNHLVQLNQIRVQRFVGCRSPLSHGPEALGHKILHIATPSGVHETTNDVPREQPEQRFRFPGLLGDRFSILNCPGEEI